MTPEERRALVRAQQKAVKAKPKKVIPPLKYPRTLENTYAKAIKRYQKKAIEAVNKTVVPRLSAIIATRRRDLKLDSYPEQITIQMMMAKEQFDMATASVDLSAYTESYGGKLARQNATAMDKQFNAGLGLIPVAPEPWLMPMLNEFVAQNTQLITSIPAQYFEKVETAIRVNVANGASVETTRKAIMKAGVQSYNRAQLIACDQTGKFFGQLTKQRNEAVGITKFVWHHSGLPNGREEHIANDGKSFSWSKGDAEGSIPGSEINCRCSSSPDFSQINN